jgi:hypothetical protein
VIARSPSGVTLWATPIEGAQLEQARSPEALFGAVLTRARVAQRRASVSPLLPNGGWSQGTAIFERRNAHWFARIERVDATHALMVVAIAPRASLSSADAEHIDVALNSAHRNGAATRYVGPLVFTTSTRGAQRVETPAVFELRGNGELRTLVMPDLDGDSCTFRARLQPSGALRLDPDQACHSARLGYTLVLVGGQIELSGVSMRMTASGRLSFIARAGQRGPMVAGSASFNWALSATRPQG